MCLQEQSVDAGDLIKLANKGSKLFNIEIPEKTELKPLFPENMVPASEIIRFKNILELSDSQTKTACSVFRSWKGREFFEPNLKEKLVFQDCVLDLFFDVAELQMNKQTKYLFSVQMCLS